MVSLSGKTWLKYITKSLGMGNKMDHIHGDTVSHLWGNRSRLAPLLLVLLLLSGCSTKLPSAEMAQTLYLPPTTADEEDRFVPFFEVFGTASQHNRIGTPAVRLGTDGDQVFIDTSQATVFVQRRLFSTNKGVYTNLIYRIHFSKIPRSFWPFYLGAGEHVGLFVIVTLNNAEQPLLYTTVHTCGCYLAFIPTSYLWPEAFPDSWSRQAQKVYGETLPGLLDLHHATVEGDYRVGLKIRNDTHRVMDLRLASSQQIATRRHTEMILKPHTLLENLSSQSASAPVSFFETTGVRAGYVKNSEKIWERLLMSWWTLDWRIGEDKRLGQNTADGPIFYTSIKPWQRTNSDLRNFPRFLNYWGWKL